MKKKYKIVLITLIILIVCISIMVVVYYIKVTTPKIKIEKIDNLDNIYAFAKKDDRYIIALMKDRQEKPIFDMKKEKYHILGYENGRLYLYLYERKSGFSRTYYPISYIDLVEDNYELHNICSIESYGSEYQYVYNGSIYYKDYENNNIKKYNLNTSEEEILEVSTVGLMYLDKNTGFLYYSDGTTMYWIDLETLEKKSYNTTDVNRTVNRIAEIWAYGDNIYITVLSDSFECFQYNKETKQVKKFPISRMSRYFGEKLYDNKLITSRWNDICTVDLEGNVTQICKPSNMEYINNWVLIYDTLILYNNSNLSSTAMSGVDLKNGKELNLDEIPINYLLYSEIFYLN